MKKTRQKIIFETVSFMKMAEDSTKQLQNEKKDPKPKQIGMIEPTYHKANDVNNQHNNRCLWESANTIVCAYAPTKRTQEQAT